MSLFGIKEKKELARLQIIVSECESTIIGLKSDIDELKTQLTPEQQDVAILTTQLAELERQKSKDESAIAKLLSELASLNKELDEKKKEIVQLDDEILYQSFSLYRPIYDFSNSEKYKDRLEVVRQKQKMLIKNNAATDILETWVVDGSVAKGKKMTNDITKQMLRIFNVECENAIGRVKFNNFDSMRSRIVKSHDSINKLNAHAKLSINSQYLELKLEELNLAIEYAMKKQEEKEEQKRIREERREQIKLEKEIEEARKRIEKEQTHYANALLQIERQIFEYTNDEQKAVLEEKKKEILSQIDRLDIEMKDVDYREKMPKAGYVYVISNIGAFGENIYKIGMTRRLDPQERIDELGDASVPFRFDVHAMIFAEDAPKLESALHRTFDGRRINLMNNRKEFFRVTLDEIKDVICINFDKTVEFTDIPEAADYRQSLMSCNKSPAKTEKTSNK